MKRLYAMLIFSLLVALVAVAGRTHAAAAASRPCANAPAYHALDFSLGSWSISVPGEAPQATSTIRLDVRGCAVVEEWKGQNDVGINIDAYNEADGHWHRFFVDSYGKVHTFEGSAGPGAIVYRGTSREPDGRVFINRLTLRSEGPNTMTQLWQKSPDGKTWSTAFQGTYTRAQ